MLPFFSTITSKSLCLYIKGAFGTVVAVAALVVVVLMKQVRVNLELFGETFGKTDSPGCVMGEMSIISFSFLFFFPFPFHFFLFTFSPFISFSFIHRRSLRGDPSPERFSKSPCPDAPPPRLIACGSHITLSHLLPKQPVASSLSSTNV